MSKTNIDSLVEEVASRVRSRLAGEGGGAGGVGGAVSVSSVGSVGALSGAGDPAGGGQGTVCASVAGSPCVSDQQACSGCGRCVTHKPGAVRELRLVGAERVGASPGTGEVAADLASMIDHTLLRADATAEDVRKLCEEARRYTFATVCVNSAMVPRARAFLAGSPVQVCAVVGFPLGAMTPGAKAYEAREAVRQGASEVDMVINIGALKSRDYGLVLDDIGQVVRAARPAKVKVILETGSLCTEEKVIAVTLSKLGGAHFVKTSTGFGPGGATAEDVALMRRLVGSEMGVKASGGIRTREDAEKMVAAGANRIGASASVAIVTGKAAEKNAPAATAKPSRY
jgi:deoxyribose-phosphate aldolase